MLQGKLYVHEKKSEFLNVPLSRSRRFLLRRVSGRPPSPSRSGEGTTLQTHWGAIAAKSGLRCKHRQQRQWREFGYGRSLRQIESWAGQVRVVDVGQSTLGWAKGSSVRPAELCRRCMFRWRLRPGTDCPGLVWSWACRCFHCIAERIQNLCGVFETPGS